MRLLGFSCGRKMGNSEVLLKEALMGAGESGVNVEILRLLDLDVRPCIFCKLCLWRQKGPESCVIKDDAAFVWEKILDSDGLIISAPVYSLTPPGYLLQIRDRAFGPKVDVGFMVGRKKQKAQGREVFVDERCFKTRAGAFISHGGSVTSNWLSFGLPMLHTMTFALKIAVVDQMEVLGTGSSFPEGVASGPVGACLNQGQVVLNEKAIARARELGRHVAKAMGKPAAQMGWMGDEPGMCPVCHLNQLTITKKNLIECPLCGISGELKIKTVK